MRKTETLQATHQHNLPEKMTFKNFLPFDNFKLLTNLSVPEVQQRIKSITEHKKYFSLLSFGNTAKPYRGRLTEDSFTISRIINYRNSFLPIIRGRVSAFLRKTQIAIKMRPVAFVLIFMSFWLGVIGLVCLGVILGTIMHLRKLSYQGSSIGGLIPFVMFVFGYALLTLSYKAESNKSKAFLKQLLEAEEV